MIREEKHFTKCRGFRNGHTDTRRGDPTWSPGNVTFHPMRDYAEWKNLSLSAADFEMETRTSVGATPRGRPET